MFGAGVGGPSIEDGARRPLLGVDGPDLAGVRSKAEPGMFPVLARILCMGKAGKAMLGGPLEDRDGRGSAVAMVNPSERQRRDDDDDA